MDPEQRLCRQTSISLHSRRVSPPVARVVRGDRDDRGGGRWTAEEHRRGLGCVEVGGPDDVQVVAASIPRPISLVDAGNRPTRLSMS